jgi:hypothetical protein
MYLIRYHLAVIWNLERREFVEDKFIGIGSKKIIEAVRCMSDFIH